jgi:hypothetical protein
VILLLELPCLAAISNNANPLNDQLRERVSGQAGKTGTSSSLFNVSTFSVRSGSFLTRTSVPFGDSIDHKFAYHPTFRTFKHMFFAGINMDAVALLLY